MKAGLFFLFETLGEKTPSQAYKEAVEESEYGEKLGFHAVCPAEHHFSQHYGIMPDVIDFCSWVASRTKKIKLWPMVIVAPLHEPIRLAERIAMLDQFSEGRVIFSIGSGYRAYEFDPFGLSIKDNWIIMRHVAEFCTKAWKNGSISYECEWFSVKNANVLPKPYQTPHPPVYITTSRDDQIRWCAERGYFIVPAAGFSVWEVKHSWDTHTKTAEETGNPKLPEKVFFKWIYVDESDRRAREIGENAFMKTIMAFMHGGEFLYKLLMKKIKETMPEEVRETIDWNAPISFDNLTRPDYTPFAWGDPKRVIDILKPFSEAGATMFIGGFNIGALPSEQIKKSMKLFAEKVLPYI